MAILDVVTSVLSGGLTGVVGVGIQRIFEYKSKQLDIEMSREKYAHEVSMKDLDSKILAQEWASRAKVAEIESAAQVEVADSKAFALSFNEPQRYAADVKPTLGQGWLLIALDFTRGIVRPLLTIYLVFITSLLYLHCRSMLDVGVSAAQAFELVDKIVETLLYLCTCCVLWWFGSRAAKPGR